MSVWRDVVSLVRKKDKASAAIDKYFKVLTAYQPCYTSYEGGLYEMEITRSAIHAFANHASMLRPEVSGAARPDLERILALRPNPWMDTASYIYRLATSVSVYGTAFIIPLLDADQRIVGYYPALPTGVRIVEDKGTQWCVYQLRNGQSWAVEFDRAGILTEHFFRNDLFGEGNAPMRETMELLHAENQGIIEGAKNSAAIRFLAKMAKVLSPETMEAERKRFREENLGSDNTNGVLLFDAKYDDVKQIDSKPYSINPGQRKLIEENVFSYFGVNTEILQNKYTSGTWQAFYEGKIEPFALKMSLVHTAMTFNDREVGFGNEIFFSSNRLQYATVEEKTAVVSQLFDRGLITYNDVMDTFNLPRREDGDVRYIRGEYVQLGGNGAVPVQELGNDMQTQEVGNGADQTDKRTRLNVGAARSRLMGVDIHGV